MTTVTVYTDGSCKGNPGRGGWAVVRGENVVASGHAKYTTNNEMEVKAALEAVKRYAGKASSLVIKTDSKNVIGWLSANWKCQSNPTLAEMVRECKERIAQFGGEVKFELVTGHSGEAGNDLADAEASWQAVYGS